MFFFVEKIPGSKNCFYIKKFFAQELKAIEKHELDMISLGNTYIMKSHKGEIEIEKDDFVRDREKGER